MRPLVASGIGVRKAGRVALAADTFSIATMEIMDTLIVVAVPGAMAAGLLDGLFWRPALSLVVRSRSRCQLNPLIARGLGHAVVPGHH